MGWTFQKIKTINYNIYNLIKNPNVVLTVQDLFGIYRKKYI